MLALRRRSIFVLRLLRSPSFSTATATAKGSGPPPIRVAITESAGRGVFATRKVTAGELIHTAKPLVVHPTPFLSHKVCYSCLRWLGRGALPGGDETMEGIPCYFCSEECREQSKLFSRTRGLKYPYILKRLTCMVISGAASSDCLDILQPDSLNTDKILQMEEEYELLKETLLEAQIEKEKMAFLTKQWYVTVLARIRINAFRVELVAGSYDDLLASAAACIESAAAVGNAVYMLPSFYNHDCDPNTHIIWIDNAEARLKALRDIEDGEELRICYIDASMDVEARQTVLSQGFGFHCQCLRCSSGD